MSFSGYTPGNQGAGYWQLIPSVTPATIVQTVTGGAIVETTNFIMGAIENTLGTGAILSSNPPDGAKASQFLVIDNATAAIRVQDNAAHLASELYAQIDSIQIDAQDTTPGANKGSSLFVNTDQFRALHAYQGAHLYELTINKDYLLKSTSGGNLFFAIDSNGKMLTNQITANAPTPLTNYIATVPLYNAAGALVGNIPLI